MCVEACVHAGGALTLGARQGAALRLVAVLNARVLPAAGDAGDDAGGGGEVAAVTALADGGFALARASEPAAAAALMAQCGRGPGLFFSFAGPAGSPSGCARAEHELDALPPGAQARVAPAVALGQAGQLLDQWLAADSLARLAPALAAAADDAAAPAAAQR